MYIYINVYVHMHTPLFMMKRFEELYAFGPLKLLNRLIIYIHNEKEHMALLYRLLQEMKNTGKALRKSQEGAGLYRMRR